MADLSRELTPAEYLAFEQSVMIKQNNETIFDFMRSLSISFNGNVERLHPDEEVDICEQYPLMGKLLNGFYKLYQELSDIPGGLDTLNKFEKELEDYVYNDKRDLESPAIKWFLGKLDEGFYYSATNHNLFKEHILETAKNLSVNKSLDSKISDAANKNKNDKIDIEKSQINLPER